MTGITLTLIKSVFALLILTIGLPSFAKDDKYNLAFDEAFVGYLSDRLALQLARKEHLEPQPGLDKADAGFRAMHLMDIRMAYRAKLISCDGPLEEFSEHLQYFYFELDESSHKTGVLSFVSSKEHLIWPIVENWNKKVEDEIMRTHHKDFKVFPDCIIKGYEVKKAKEDQS